jgi:serine/threonine-protein kinase
MGSVEAVAERMPDGGSRVLALKRLLRTAGADSARLEMFLREAKLTTLLEHPNVVRSLAFGESAGEVYLAMEYVAGEPLSRLISVVREREGSLPLGVTAYILSEACEGLHAAHELCGPDGEPLGVVHRDVSPHNIMVGYDGGVKLLDFGVAKVDLVDCVARTKTGEVKGKTAYMSPEQAMGEVVDRRSDLYSVGAVLFECITGRRMWGTGTDLEVLRRLALEAPPRLGDVAPDVPQAIVDLHERLVERDPNKRFATAAELAEALRPYATLPPSGVRVDAGTIRELMARLFEQDRLQREAAIASALSVSDDAPEGTTRSEGGAGESGPVFVTPGRVAVASTSRRTGVAVAVAVLAVGGFLGALRVVRSPAPSGASIGHEPALSAGLGQGTHQASVARSAEAADGAAPAVAVPPASSAVLRPFAMPSVRRPVFPRRPVPPEASPSASAVPSTLSSQPKPPDVDPTPF